MKRKYVRDRLDEPEVVRRYNDGESLEKIAKFFGCSVSPIKDILIEHGVSIRDSHETINRVRSFALRAADPELRELITSLYFGPKELSLQQVADILGISSPTVARLIRAYGLDLREPGGHYGQSSKWDKLPAKEIIKQYENLDSTSDIGARYGVRGPTISKLLKHHGVHVRTPAEAARIRKRKNRRSDVSEPKPIPKRMPKPKPAPKPKFVVVPKREKVEEVSDWEILQQIQKKEDKLRRTICK